MVVYMRRGEGAVVDRVKEVLKDRWAPLVLVQDCCEASTLLGRHGLLSRNRERRRLPVSSVCALLCGACANI